MAGEAGRSRLYTVQLVGGVVIGLGLLGYFVARMDRAALIEALSGVDPLWLTIAVVLMLLDYLLQAWRWAVLLKPVDPGFTLRLAWSGTAVGWAFNTLLPLRGGNFLRPAVVALRRDIPYTTLLFTTVAEYVLDLFAILGMLAATLYYLPPDLLGPENTALLREGGVAMSISGLFALAGTFLIVRPGARVVLKRLLRPLPPGRFRAWILLLFDQLKDGLRAVGDPLRFFEGLLITLAIWGCWLLVIFATCRALHLSVPFGAALMMETLLTLAMHVPQAPGFLGVFQLVTTQTLSVWGAPQGKADAVALVFWLVNFGPITVLGLYESSRAGLGLMGARKQALEGLTHGPPPSPP